ncbi:MAG: hypothetical protein ACKOCM_09975 [Cyanobacteriota bacterium]
MTDDAPSVDFQAHLNSLHSFRNWLASLVEAQQPLEEWSLSLDQLRERWSTQASEPSAQAEHAIGRLFF